MNLCVMCDSKSNYGMRSSNGNFICLDCVTVIKGAHFKVFDFPFEEANK